MSAIDFGGFVYWNCSCSWFCRLSINWYQVPGIVQAIDFGDGLQVPGINWNCPHTIDFGDCVLVGNVQTMDVGAVYQLELSK